MRLISFLLIGFLFIKSISLYAMEGSSSNANDKISSLMTTYDFSEGESERLSWLLTESKDPVCSKKDNSIQIKSIKNIPNKKTFEAGVPVSLVFATNLLYVPEITVNFSYLKNASSAMALIDTIQLNQVDNTLIHQVPVALVESVNPKITLDELIVQLAKDSVWSSEKAQTRYNQKGESYIELEKDNTTETILQSVQSAKPPLHVIFNFRTAYDFLQKATFSGSFCLIDAQLHGSSTSNWWARVKNKIQNTYSSLRNNYKKTGVVGLLAVGSLYALWRLKKK